MMYQPVVAGQPTRQPQMVQQMPMQGMVMPMQQIGGGRKGGNSAGKGTGRLLGAIEGLTTHLTTQAANQAAKEEAERVPAQERERKEEIAVTHAKFSENTQTMIQAIQAENKEFMKSLRGSNCIQAETPAQHVRPRRRYH